MLCARALFEDPAGVLGIFITNKCNFLCGHCCTESSPSAKNLLSKEQIETYLDGLPFIERIKVLHISGGEPFMNLSALKCIVNLAKKSKKRIAINTNGSFLNKKTIREYILENSEVITDLFISFSVWHSEFITKNEIIESITFSLRAVKFVEVMVVSSNDDNTDYVNFFRNHFSASSDKIRFSASHVEPYGRAIGNSKTTFLDRQISPSFQGCHQVNRPTLCEDGSFILCCNTLNLSAGARGLVLGNVKYQSLNSILNLHNKDVLSIALRSIGPHLISELAISSSSLSSLIDPAVASDADPCKSCFQLTKSISTSNKVREFLETPPIKACLKIASSRI